ncbi:class I SAM-dependent methyltransferase [Nodosilinea sp. E11]|uniref:class I SAM-dependent methyltransferase n=1 Tax=Nodosilinea sp. E11 TaxID=3037479 RepID=UPI002934B1DA|nr:methyltransferase domain-containing protein [Nodosilinea sp. E11]WOD40833.1 methyltransferase domain-containing protein [Nodosilinea sp. E11]
MTLKSLARNLLPPGLYPLALQVAGKSADQQLKKYHQGGRIPWSEGYLIHKTQAVAAAIRDRDLLTVFRDRRPLPKNYGLGLDERCVEYPWLFAHLPETASTLLDAGSVLNHDYIVSHPYFDSRRLHIVTLSPEAMAYWERGIGYFYDDLRHLPLRDEFYDAIVCLSTLEHVGLDNSIYTRSSDDIEAKSTDFIAALHELRRVLKPGGALFISVPFGTYQNFGSFQQFDAALLNKAIAAFGPAQVVEKTYFKYFINGWQVATEADCANCEYVQSDEWFTQTPGKPKPSDGAAAARAVACVHLLR